jgi:hypothetical protein
MRTRYISTLLLGLACSAAFSHAQQVEEGGAASALPEKNTQNGITYVCGGVGSGEAASMKQAAPQYDLMLTFATKSGEYLADVNVDISDARGRSLLNTACDGPIMLVDMPKAGRYRVRAELAGHATSGIVQVRPNARVKTLPLVLPREQGEAS